MKSAPKRERGLGRVPIRPQKPEPCREESLSLHKALSTTLGWRRALALAVSQEGTLVASNRAETDGAFALGELVAPSRAIKFGDVPLRLVTESLAGLDPAREIPSIVTDGMLRSIVEGHFAVWYVWHVPTGTILAPGMRELLDIPQHEVPTIVEEWLERVHPEDLPRMVGENDDALRTNSAFRSEYRFRRGDGSYISISDWGIVLSGEDGRAEWMAGGLREHHRGKAPRAGPRGISPAQRGLVQEGARSNVPHRRERGADRREPIGSRLPRSRT